MSACERYMLTAYLAVLSMVFITAASCFCLLQLDFGAPGGTKSFALCSWPSAQHNASL